MGKETECRYEVKYIPKNLEILDVLLISQAYLVAKELDELRVRKSVSLFTRDVSYYVTTKVGSGEVREELERVVSKAEYDLIASACTKAPITKVRVVLASPKNCAIDFSVRNRLRYVSKRVAICSRRKTSFQGEIRRELAQ